MSQAVQRVHIHHPALLKITRITPQAEEVIMDGLSSLEEGRIESDVIFPIHTPAVLKVTTLPGISYRFIIAGKIMVVDHLNDILDVLVPSPTDSYVLYWDQAAGKWKCKANTRLALTEQKVITEELSTVTFSDLDLDAANLYLLLATIHNPQADNLIYEMFFNNDLTPANYHSQWLGADGATVAASRQSNPDILSVLAGDTATTGWLIGRARHQARVAALPHMEQGGTQINIRLKIMSYDITANITTLTLRSRTTGEVVKNGFGINSYLSLYQLRN